MGEIITRNFIDRVPNGPGGHFVILVHQLSIRIPAKSSACATSKIPKSDQELAKPMIIFLDSWNKCLYSGTCDAV